MCEEIFTEAVERLRELNNSSLKAVELLGVKIYSKRANKEKRKEVVTKQLKKGDKVTLIGFGTFEVSKRSARTGRNPQTGETMKIKASKAPKFKAGKALKDAVNGTKKK